MNPSPASTPPLAALAPSILLSSFAGSSASVALPALASVFAAPLAQVRWVALSYLAGVGLLVVLAGWLGDVAGRRRLLLAGLGLFVAASAACGSAPSLAWLVAARSLQGAAGAVMMALPPALAAQGGTGRAMGLMGSMSAAGTALGPALGGLLLAHWGWPAIFLACAAAGACAWPLAARGLAPDPRAAQRPPANPLAPFAMLREAAIGIGTAGGALAMVPMAATLIAGPFYLARTLGLGADGAGFVMAAGPLGATLAGWPAGRLVDAWGTARATRIGQATMAAGCALLALAAKTTGVAGYIGALLVLTAGYALFQAANGTATMRHAGPARRGAAGGLLGLARSVGALGGTALATTALVLGAGMPDLGGAGPAAMARAAALAFGLAALAPLLGLGLAALVRLRGRGRR